MITLTTYQPPAGAPLGTVLTVTDPTTGHTATVQVCGTDMWGTEYSVSAPGDTRPWDTPGARWWVNPADVTATHQRASEAA